MLCVGHLVCAVIADSEVQAKRAAEKVKIVYQDLEPLILTIEVTAPEPPEVSCREETSAFEWDRKAQLHSSL